MLLLLLVVVSLFLAYANGANDNFKGVATLYGSRVLNYRWAIGIATVATLLGSIAAIFLAQELVSSFSGKGLVPQQTAGQVEFLIAVGLGAASTVLLATRFGFPISTTHSLVGGLLGAGLMAVGLEVNFARLSTAFVIPLLVSPFIAFLLGYVVYQVFTRFRKRLKLNKEACICVGENKQFIPISAAQNMQIAQSPAIKIALANREDCVVMYTDNVWGWSVQSLLDRAHILSAAAVSFARGLNDTPKIAGLLVIVHSLQIELGMIAIAIGIALGGLIYAKRVAETISHKITKINHGQGFSANLVTSFLVIVASKFGVPVSTTHVSVGSIFGISMTSDEKNTRVIKSILLSWLVTLPTAAILSGLVYWLL